MLTLLEKRNRMLRLESERIVRHGFEANQHATVGFKQSAPNRPRIGSESALNQDLLAVDDYMYIISINYKNTKMHRERN